MNISRFFIDRPIFAAVLSITIFVAGLVAIPLLPVSEYPEVVPPTIQVRTAYPGATPKVVSETVAAPLEEVINGVENMMYMKSVASSDGALVMNITFRPGTDVDKAQVAVQNRVSQALPRLPEDVRRLGVVTQKQALNWMIVVHLRSPDGRYNAVYLRNYANMRIRDELNRIPGLGNAQVIGGGDYAMRIWLDPNKLSARGLIPSDVVRAVREQNVQISTGQLGAPPTPNPPDFLLSINAAGRLVTEAEFADIVVRVGDHGDITRLGDVARIELGASTYSLRSILDGQPAVAIGITQAPGSNVVDVANQVRAKMAELGKQFPEGLEWTVVYDPTDFVKDSIRSVIETLLEAALLVVIVVILFLQTWRASVIPLLAVPISIIGTFAVLLLLGFTINTLTLFGLVLAIGIVVDDAIVVVENVERSIQAGLEPHAAARQAMREVSGPIIAVALVLCAVFVPMTFMIGLTGQFFRQFAVTIAISTVISAINSLTLSPALAARLLRPHDARRGARTGVIGAVFGWLFRGFDHGFRRSASGYAAVVRGAVRYRRGSFVLYAIAIAFTVIMFRKVPGGFVPTQDKLYLIGVTRLPEGSSLDRTEAVVREMSARALATPGVGHVVAFAGLNPSHYSNTPNTATVLIVLEDAVKRTRTAPQIAGELSAKFAGIKDAFAFAIMPPPILGLGTGAGFSLYVQDRAGRGDGELAVAVRGLAGTLAKQPGIIRPFSSYQPNVPQLSLSINRTKAKIEGVALNDLFETLQIYLGSVYVNDFNRFGRTFQVIAQSDGVFRERAEQIGMLKTRNTAGQLVPIGSVIDIGNTYGPDPVVRYNGFPAADLSGQADPVKSSSEEAIATVTQVASSVLPTGFQMEWSDLSFQQVKEGRSNLIVFPIALLLVFLVLAALYESWILPLAIVLIVPLCLLAALIGVRIVGGDRNVFVQIGIVVLMGLATKNAILIVEFARELERQGRTVVDAAIEAARLRLRPIVMTSLAFIAGVVPLVFATGAGYEVRRMMGVTVFSGMIGVTLAGLVLTPVFYVALRTLVTRRARPLANPSPVSGEPLT